MFILLALIALAQSLVFQPRPGTSLLTQFNEYNQFWNKTHATQAHKQARFEAFKMNLEKIQAANAKTRSKGFGATFGLTKFSDLSFAEFKQMNGFKPKNPLQTNLATGRLTAPSGAIDWVAKGMTTPVKDQGQCGSCWAFSTVETVESANLLAGRSVVPGSPQEIVDCDSADAGCNGGDPQEALQWVVNQGGLDTDSCYPYVAQDQTCASSSCTPSSGLMISTVSPVAADENVIYNTLQTQPLSICCDAEPWQNYNGGILTADQCGENVDHAIQLTGYSPDQGGYWIVRNSWGADWGEDGFIYLSFGENTCAITSEVTGAGV